MRLLRRADFNAGANINTFWRMPCRGALDAGSKKALTWDNKHITWFGKWGKTPVTLFCQLEVIYFVYFVFDIDFGSNLDKSRYF